MSKFTDMLEKAGVQRPAPMGFGPASRQQTHIPQIVLVGQTTSAGLPTKAKVAKVEVDAFLVSLEKDDDATLDSIAGSLEQCVWGVRLGDLSAALVDRLREKGCDFLIFEAENTEAAVLAEDETGKIITVGPDVGEETARTIGEMPLDGALFSLEKGILPLTVGKLIDIQLVRSLVDKPLIMEAPADLGREELEALRNVGIAGLLMDLSSPSTIAETRRAIEDLPRSRSRPARREAILPVVPGERQAQTQGPGEEDDDTEDF